MLNIVCDEKHEISIFFNDFLQFNFLLKRERKQKKVYADEWALGDDEFDGGRAFSVAEKLASPAFAQQGMVREMKGADLTVA
jgi:hypothetical protein